MISRMYTAGAAGTTTTSSIDVRMDDVISEVVLDLSASGVADADTFYVELSWLATASRGTNDTTAVIASTEIGVELSTSGATQLAKVLVLRPNAKIFAGERLYLHCVNVGTGVSKAYAFIVTGKDLPMSRSGRK